MKRVMKFTCDDSIGKIYDTETAEVIQKYKNNFPAWDKRSIEKILYRTKKGTFFFVGEGGPDSGFPEPKMWLAEKNEALIFLSLTNKEKAIEFFSMSVEEG